MLRQNIEGRRRHFQAIEISRADRPDQGRAFDQFIARCREKPALRHGADPVAGTSHALKRHCNGARRSDLANKIHVAYVDAQFQRRGRNHHTCLARLQPFFGGEANLPRKASMMGSDGLCSQRFLEAILKMMRNALDKPARVDENKCRPVFVDKRGEPVIHVVPDGVRGNGAKFVFWNFNLKIHLSPMPDVDDRGPRAAADEEVRDSFDRPLGCGETNPYRRRGGQLVQPFER